jgi:Lon protease-like protein
MSGDGGDGRDDGSGKRLPLFPLSDLVHFPHTDLKLKIFEQRYRRLVRDVIDGADAESRRIGLVLLKPGARRDGDSRGYRSQRGDRPEVFPGGTAGRIVRCEFLPDGRTEVLLHGEFRFELDHEIPGGEPYRQALVRPIEEPRWNEGDAGIVLVKRALLALARSLVTELGDSFPLAAPELDGLAAGSGFEELVNRMAAELDLPAVRKLALLCESLPDRALSLLSILHSRQQVVDELRPFRHLAGKSQLN